MTRLAVFSLCLVVASGLCAAQTVEWTCALEHPSAAPTLYPNETEPTGVVVTSGTSIILLNGDGSVAWQCDQQENLATPATVADIDGDGKPEILAARAGGKVLCLTEGCRWKWIHDFDTPAGGFKSLAVADLMPEPGLEVLSGFDDGWVNCLSARGKLLWRFFGDQFRAGGAFAVADVDGDGAPEIVYGTDNGHVYCLDGWGRVEWRYFELAPYGRSGPNVADLDGDGSVEVLITRSNVGNATCLMALDGATGAFKWRTDDVMQGYVSNATVDFEGDGTFEVLHADKGNHLYCENADGSRRWTAQLSGRGIFWAPCVADVDGDGHLEIVSAMRGHDPETKACTYVVGDDGQVKHALELGTGANASPAVGDIDGDGELEVIVVTDGPPQVQALTWHAAGRVAWPSLRGNSRMTAHGNVPPGTPSQGPGGDGSEGLAVNTGDVCLGDNEWTISWDAPVGDDAFLEVTTASQRPIGRAKLEETRPAPGADELKGALRQMLKGLDESQRTEEARSEVATTRIIDLARGQQHAQVPVRLTSPKASRVRIALHNGEGAVMTTGLEATPLAADFCDFEAVQRAYANAFHASGSSSDRPSALIEWMAHLRGESELIGELVASGYPEEEIADQATELRRKATLLKELADRLADIWGDGPWLGTFAVAQDPNPWDRFDPRALPEEFLLNYPDSPPEHLRPATVRAYGNEFENLALSLLNMTTEPVEVRCMFMAPNLGQQRPQGEPEEVQRHIRLRRLVPVPTAMQDRVFDALPELDRSRSITLPPGEARQLWVEIKTHGLEPGVHEWTLYLGSLTKPPTVWAVPIRVEVWPVALPTDVFDKMNWSNFNVGQISEQAVQDMVDHCMSVIYGPPLPRVPVDGEGTLAGDVDWTRFDETMARVPKHFTMLWGGPPPRQWPEGGAPDDDSEAYLNGFRTAIHALAGHLAEHGFGYDQWAFYPIDEPWNTGFTHIPHLRRFCQMVKRAEPRAQNYTDPAGLVRVEYLDEFKDLIDIWQPELNTLKRDPKLVAWFQKNAKHFWAYEAPGPAKDWHPLGHYRGYGWLAWHFGLEGFGYWVYKGVDAWWPVDIDYSAVYQINDDVVASRRWQADRDGVEDYRAFYVLDQEIERARAAARETEAAGAEALIEQALDDVVRWQIGTIDEITRMTREYEIDFELLCDYRRRIAETIIGLRELAGEADTEPATAP